MPSLNYKHLHYFWTVAREGSITRASEVLHVTQPAISAQLAKFEDRLGEKLFMKSGRNLVLTEAGRVAFGYAEEIFALGRELEDTLQGRLAGRPMRLAVGISNALPKLLAYRLVSPALRMRTPVQLVVHDDRPERLLADLGIHALDLVLTDSPLPPTVNVRAYNHLLGECGVTVFGTAARIEALEGEFPASLDGAPFLLPTANTTMRRSLDQWFEATGIRPMIAAEIEDSAVLKAFGEAGVGLFAAPTTMEAEIRRMYRVRALGRIDAIRERFYAISVERRLKHPAVVAISEAARGQLFGADVASPPVHPPHTSGTPSAAETTS
jgi:LysR family transcriptional regulator, transcriptional activator of nhaA